ncbi:sugar ABC transporter ATP-binding protein [Rhodoferax sp.]|uniref:sugar ABC transporter ATP-binding protein n=1 Tax=Rhodoferax sp. TaxID=50421 RepID=UPI002606262C|nr:sugar ABC transporter ATP-binding protein [Rhodoferax sp.]MDD2925298.1 sugar ABC transporter ATP-binding protein [Rhodoferax sp.]
MSDRNVQGNAPFVRVSGVTMKFSGVTALNALDWDILPGEVHCLIGENGCGKSTTIKVLSGVNQPEPGAVIEIDGQRREHLTPHLSKQLGIQVIYQDLSLFPNLSVAENISIEEALGSYASVISRPRMRERAAATMARLGVNLPLDALVGDLPIATRQLVAICRGMAADARLLFMDEPTASLTRSEVNALLEVVRRLQADGVAVVFVSHKLDEVVEIADRVTVLRDGNKLGTYPAEGLNDKRLAELMTGLDIEHHVHARDCTQAMPVLQVRALTRQGQYRHLSLEVRQGEVVGLVGLLGAGRTELALSLFGMNPPDSGEVLLQGRPMLARTNRQAIDAGIAYVSEDRLSLGLNMRQSVQDNMVLAVLNRISAWAGWLTPERRETMARAWRNTLNIKIPSLTAPVSQLSGGNAQRVVLAKWLATKPKLLILDSPTVGVDIGNKQGIYEIVHDLARQGVAVLMISDEVPEVYYTCDRVLHMRDGEIIESFVPGVASEAQIMESVYA